MALGNLPRRMPREEKPYRVYRGGRAKGKVPTTRARVRSRAEAEARGGAPQTEYRGPGAAAGMPRAISAFLQVDARKEARLCKKRPFEIIV